MLVSGDGEWLVENSPEFLAALGDPEPDYDATAFAVRNLGFIRFQMLDDSVIEVDLHPRNTQLPALLAVQQQILSSRVKLFRIKYLESSWHSEIMISAEQAISRLSELCSPEVTLPTSERFFVEPRLYRIIPQRRGSVTPARAKMAHVFRSLRSERHLLCHQASVALRNDGRRRSAA